MKYAIGIDLGGTKVSGILMDEQGKVIQKEVRPTPSESPKEDILNTIEHLIEDLSTKTIEGIGIGHPGFSMDGKLTSIYNIPSFKNINLAEEMSERTKNTIKTENDANCFALAEHAYGAGRNYANMFGIIIGSGIGGGIIINNKLYSGAHGGAGEVGFTPLGEKSFELYGSGKNIMKTYKELDGPAKHENPADVFRGTDEIAKQLTREVFEYYAKGFATIITILDPEAIIIGGGVSNAFHLFENTLKKQMPKYAPNANTKKVIIAKNELGDDAGVIGAAALVFE
jgi:glucokinase